MRRIFTQFLANQLKPETATVLKQRIITKSPKKPMKPAPLPLLLADPPVLPLEGSSKKNSPYYITHATFPHISVSSKKIKNNAANPPQI